MSVIRVFIYINIRLEGNASIFSNFKIVPLNNLYSNGDVIRYGDIIAI